RSSQSFAHDLSSRSTNNSQLVQVPLELFQKLTLLMEKLPESFTEAVQSSGIKPNGNSQSSDSVPPNFPVGGFSLSSPTTCRVVLQSKGKFNDYAEELKQWLTVNASTDWLTKPRL